MARTRKTESETILYRANRLRQQKQCEAALAKESSPNTVAISASNNETRESAEFNDRQQLQITTPTRTGTRDDVHVNSEGSYPVLLSAITPETCADQRQSPLFNRLPYEIRMEIYGFVLRQYESESRRYPMEALYYRPGCEAPKCIDTSILYTCRLLYREARLLPVRNATHEFWYEVHKPPHAGNCAALYPNHNFYGTSGIPMSHQGHMQNFHLYGSASVISSGYYSSVIDILKQSPRAREITITIPYTGWLNWDYGVAPSFYDGDLWKGFTELNWPSTLNKIQLRLETMEVFQKEVHEIASYVAAYNFVLTDAENNKDFRSNMSPSPSPTASGYLSTGGREPKTWKWTGPHSNELKERWQPHIHHLGDDPMEVPELWYYVVEVTWQRENTTNWPGI